MRWWPTSGPPASTSRARWLLVRICLRPSGLTCYRIVEEALTNVTLHSAARTASVSVKVDATRVLVAVTDPGPARSDTKGGGRGLLGLAERVALFGGRHRVGPTDAGGFEVSVILPRGST